MNVKTKVTISYYQPEFREVAWLRRATAREHTSQVNADTTSWKFENRHQNLRLLSALNKRHDHSFVILWRGLCRSEPQADLSENEPLRAAVERALVHTRRD